MSDLFTQWNRTIPTQCRTTNSPTSITFPLYLLRPTQTMQSRPLLAGQGSTFTSETTDILRSSGQCTRTQCPAIANKYSMMTRLHVHCSCCTQICEHNILNIINYTTRYYVTYEVNTNQTCNKHISPNKYTILYSLSWLTGVFSAKKLQTKT